MLVENVQDILADFGKLSLDLFPVALDHGNLGLVTLGFLLLLDGRHDTPRSAASPDDVLIGDGQQVTLLDGEFLV
jgi:hypothetical protein